MSNSLLPHGLQPTRFLRPWYFPGKSTGVGCHCLLLLTTDYLGIPYLCFCCCWFTCFCFKFSGVFFSMWTISYSICYLLQYCLCCLYSGFFVLFCFHFKACVILAPRPLVEPTIPALEGEVLTTGLWKSLSVALTK